MKKINTVLLMLCCIFSNAQIVITQLAPNKAKSAVKYHFLSSTGIVSGSLQNVTFDGDSGGLGVFGGTSNIGFIDGIILSTDSTTYIANTPSQQISGFYMTPGDPDLQMIASGPVQDAAALQFDFRPRTDTLTFNYVFASEEYPEFVCSQFNDVFGLFITGPNPSGGSYNAYNIALIPGTSLPVSINSVNPGSPGSSSGGGSCNGVNQSLAYSSLYTTNTGSSIIFDGFTTPLQALVPVVPCAQYHIKIAVGNVSDGAYDSGVFLEANSFGGRELPCITSFLEEEKNDLFSLTPNPFSDIVVLKSKQNFLPGSNVFVLTPDGNILEQITLNMEVAEIQFSLKQLTPGCYFLKMIDKNQTAIKKIIKL